MDEKDLFELDDFSEDEEEVSEESAVIDEDEEDDDDLLEDVEVEDESSETSVEETSSGDILGMSEEDSDYAVTRPKKRPATNPAASAGKRRAAPVAVSVAAVGSRRDGGYERVVPFPHTGGRTMAELLRASSQSGVLVKALERALVYVQTVGHSRQDEGEAQGARLLGGNLQRWLGNASQRAVLMERLRVKLADFFRDLEGTADRPAAAAPPYLRRVSLAPAAEEKDTEMQDRVARVAMLDALQCGAATLTPIEPDLYGHRLLQGNGMRSLERNGYRPKPPLDHENVAAARSKHITDALRNPEAPIELSALRWTTVPQMPTTVAMPYDPAAPVEALYDADRLDVISPSFLPHVPSRDIADHAASFLRARGLDADFAPPAAELLAQALSSHLSEILEAATTASRIAHSHGGRTRDIHHERWLAHCNGLQPTHQTLPQLEATHILTSLSPRLLRSRPIQLFRSKNTDQ